MSIQHKRKESIYFKVISEVISNNLTNSNISFTTVTDVKLSNDNSILTVYLTFENNKEKSFESIQKTKGYLRSEIAKLNKQRKVPQIVLKLDKTYEKAQKIEKILKEIKK